MNKNLQSFKQAAYLDYFRAFSIGTMSTIRKLQNAFKQQMNDNYFFDPQIMFKRVKTMLGTYQILILQINDSFQFVQIPQFGQCILKIFLQMMSIIRWLLKSMSLRPAYKQLQNNRKCQRNTIAISKPQQKIIDPKQIFKIRQKANFLIQDMQAQIFKMQQQQKQATQSHKSHTLNKQKFLKISSSDSQAILQQTVNGLIKNSQYLNQFVQLRQNSMKDNTHQNSLDIYNKIRTLFVEESTKKIQEIKNRIKIVFEQYLIQYETNKKKNMISQQVQVKIIQKNTADQNKIKKLQDQIKNLQRQVKNHKSHNDTLQQVIRQKTIEFQTQIIQLQKEKAIESITLRSALSKNQSQVNSYKNKSNNNININKKGKSKKKIEQDQQINKKPFGDIDQQQLKSEKSIKYGLKMQKRRFKHHKTSGQRHVYFQNLDDDDGTFYDDNNSYNINKNFGKEFNEEVGGNLQISSKTIFENFIPGEQNKKLKDKRKHKRYHSRSLLLRNSQQKQDSQSSQDEQNKKLAGKQRWFSLSKQSIHNIEQNSVEIQTDFQIELFNTKQIQTQNHFSQFRKDLQIYEKQIDLIIEPQTTPLSTHQRINSLLKSLKTLNIDKTKIPLRNTQQFQSQSSDYLSQKNNLSNHRNFNNNYKYSQVIHEIYNNNQCQTQPQYQPTKNSFSFNTNKNYMKYSNNQQQEQRNSNFELYKKMLQATVGCKVSSFGNEQQDKNNSSMNNKQNQNQHLPILFSLDSGINLKKLKFTQKDVWNIFFTQQNCKNYEIINFTKEQTYNKRGSYINHNHLYNNNNLKKSKFRMSNSTLKIGKQKKQSQEIYQSKNSKNNNKKFCQFSFFQNSFILILKQLNNLKKMDKQSYEQFRNFLRYPYSYLKLGNDKKWKILEKQQGDLENIQIKKKIGRIFRIHANCPKIDIGNQSMCQHILGLYEKLGIIIKF